MLVCVVVEVINGEKGSKAQDKPCVTFEAVEKLVVPNESVAPGETNPSTPGVETDCEPY